MANNILEVQLHGAYDDLVHMGDVIRTYHKNVDVLWAESCRVVSDNVKHTAEEFESFAQTMRDIAPVGVRVEILRDHGLYVTRDPHTPPSETEAA